MQTITLYLSEEFHDNIVHCINISHSVITNINKCWWQWGGINRGTMVMSFVSTWQRCWYISMSTGHTSLCWWTPYLIGRLECTNICTIDVLHCILSWQAQNPISHMTIWQHSTHISCQKLVVMTDNNRWHHFCTVQWYSSQQQLKTHNGFHQFCKIHTFILT